MYSNVNNGVKETDDNKKRRLTESVWKSRQTLFHNKIKKKENVTCKKRGCNNNVFFSFFIIAMGIFPSHLTRNI